MTIRFMLGQLAEPSSGRSQMESIFCLTENWNLSCRIIKQRVNLLCDGRYFYETLLILNSVGFQPALRDKDRDVTLSR